MPDFDILGSAPNIYSTLGSAPSSGFDVIAPNAGGRPMNGQPQNGGQQQPGAPISGLIAGALGLPTMQGANPGTSYLTQQPQQQPPGGQGQQPQQMSPLLAGILGANQPGSMAGAATGAPQGAQPQSSNMGGLLRAMIYNGQA